MDYYTGLDVSMKTTFICILDQTGKIVFECSTESDPSIIAEELRNTKLNIVKVALESGSISNWLLKELKKQKIPAVCIDSRKMSRVISININKTDKNDARMIADALRCNFISEVEEKSDEHVDLCVLLSARRTLVNSKTQFKNTIRGHLKAFGIRLGSLKPKAFITAVEKHLKKKPPLSTLAISELLKTFVSLTNQVDLLDQQIEKLAKGDEDVILLKTVPGVGPITALTFKAYLGNPHRFKDSRSVGAYFGCTPKQYSSGETVQLGKVSKCGNAEVRTILCEAATAALYRSKKWSRVKSWGHKLLKKKGHKKTTMAVARKYCTIMHRMLITRKVFEYGEAKIEKQKKAA